MLSRASQTILRQYHAPFRIAQRLQPRNLHTLGLRKPFLCPNQHATPHIRHNSTHPEPQDDQQRPLTDRPFTTTNQPSQTAAEIAARRAEQPSYQLTFTCKACSHRSTHHVTKQAYHHGTTLITCPGCKNRHLISDHLKIFGDEGMTLEDIMREKGEQGLLRKGRLGEEGDVEFYDEDAGVVAEGGGQTGKGNGKE